MLTKFFLIVIAVLLVGIIGLITSLFVQYKVFCSKIKKIEEESKQKFDNYTKRAQEILNNAKEQKESHNTGDSSTDFNACLDILHNAATKSK